MKIPIIPEMKYLLEVIPFTVFLTITSAVYSLSESLANSISEIFFPLTKREALNRISPFLIEVVVKSLLSYFTEVLGLVTSSPSPILKV